MANVWLIRTAGLLGAVASACGTALAVAGALGLTPVLFFARAQYWISGKTVSGIPIEVVVFAWFTYVTIAHWRRSAGHVLFTAFTCVGAAVVSGTGAWFLFARYPAWIIVIVTAAAAIVLVATASADALWVTTKASASRDHGRDLAFRKPLRRTAAICMVPFVVVALAIHFLAIGVTKTEALERDLRRWYVYRSAHVPPERRSALVSPRSVRVVAFVSHGWTILGNSLPARQAQVDTFRARGLPVEFVVHEFPMDRACNSVFSGSAGLGACEAAYVIRFVRDVRGDAESNEVREWIDARAAVLSDTLIRDRVEELGLSDLFREHYNELRRAVTQDVAFARSLGVEAAPRYFFNGVQVPGREEVFDTLLRFELDRRALTDRQPTIGVSDEKGKYVESPALVSIAGAHVLGDGRAPAVLIEFADFQCRYCAEFATHSLPLLRAKYIDTGLLQLAFMHAPLAALRPLAMSAAIAAECASRNGRFWALHDAFFQRPREVDALDIPRLAATVGLRPNESEARDGCPSRAVRAVVADQAALAYHLGVHSTPSFLLGYREDGERVRVVQRVSGARALPQIEEGLRAFRWIAPSFGGNTK